MLLVLGGKVYLTALETEICCPGSNQHNTGSRKAISVHNSLPRAHVLETTTKGTGQRGCGVHTQQYICKLEAFCSPGK